MIIKGNKMKKVLTLAVLTALVLGFTGCEDSKVTRKQQLDKIAVTPATIDFSNISYDNVTTK
jgi:hypothetical protein